MLRNLLLAFCLSGWVGGCASSEIIPKSTTPRVREVPGTGEYLWSADEGWIQPDRGTWGASAELRVAARAAFEAGHYADALAGFLELARRRGEAEGEDGGFWDFLGGDDEETPSAAERAAASAGAGAVANDLNYYIGECYFQLGHYESALEAFRKVYRKDFPPADLLDRARQRVFEIGLAYLQEKVTCEFAGFDYHCPDHGIEILVGASGGLITENPHLTFADYAYMEVARYYFKSKQYPEAVPIYDRVASMSGSQWSDLAEYQAALSVFLQVRGVEYDEGKLQEAHRRFYDYLERYRRGDSAEKARDKVREIAELQGAKNLEIAKYYLRESQPRSCDIYLREVLRKYPNTAAAREAREIQKKLDQTRDRW